MKRSFVLFLSLIVFASTNSFCTPNPKIQKEKSFIKIYKNYDELISNLVDQVISYAVNKNEVGMKFILLIDPAMINRKGQRYKDITWVAFNIVHQKAYKFALPPKDLQNILNYTWKSNNEDIYKAIEVEFKKSDFPDRIIKIEKLESHSSLVFSILKTREREKVENLDQVNYFADFQIFEGYEVIEIQKKNKDTTTIDLQNKTISEINIENFSGCTVNFESDEPSLVTPGTGSFKVDQGKPIEFKAKDQGNIYFQHWVVDGQNITINPLKRTVEKNLNIRAVFKNTLKPVLTKPEPNPGTTGNKLESGSTAKISPSEIDPIPINRGDPAASAELSNFLYFVDNVDFKLHRIDIRNGQTEKVNDIGFSVENGQGIIYSTFMHADRNQVGNRFIVFYKQENPSFSVFDKLSNTLDEKTYIFKEESDTLTEKIFAVDYLRTPNTFVQFFRVSRFGQYASIMIERIGTVRNDVVKKAIIAQDILSYYYNAFEKKLVWLEKALPDYLKIVIYDIPGNEKKEFKVRTIKNYNPEIWMAASDFFGIWFNNPADANAKESNRIYRVGQEQPIKTCDGSSVYCHTIQENFLHVFVSEGDVLHYLFYNSGFDEQGQVLKKKELPEGIMKNISGTKTEKIFFLNYINTYFLSRLEIDSQGTRFVQTFKLNDNFSKVIGPSKRYGIPESLKNEDHLDISAEEGQLIIKSPEGRILCVGFIQKGNKEEDKLVFRGF